MVFYIRRHRRTRRRNRWLDGIQPQRPRPFTDDPFHDDNGPPAMRSVDINTEDGHWDQKGILASSGSSHGHQNFGQVNASIVPTAYPMFHDGTFNQPDKHQLQSIGIALSTDSNRAHFRHSWTPSTPSIYPVSLSPGEDEWISDAIVPNLTRGVTVSSLPPRPPRSHLRERAKSIEQVLPTPPASNQPSPISESRPQDVHFPNRKAVPDVRSNSSSGKYCRFNPAIIGSISSNHLMRRFANVLHYVFINCQSIRLPCMSSGLEL
ncbi:hypothetical protein BYT27DRAFT_6566989 [Phlegmacium glaucopus]|nr:hypothetical protein BYT27DRAFT_6566989 [Phlegmacium glaucopus]